MTPKPTFEARAQMIFDAAQRLFIRYGFDKTTMSDIAKEAGVSKGAIYLHHKSKEALFEALLTRELQRYTEDWFERVQADPMGGTIGGIYRTVQQALNHNPLMRALFRQDRHFFGSYIKNPNNIFQTRRPGTRREFVEMMQAAGAIRDDMDAAIIAHIMNIFAYGLIAMDEVMPAEEIPDMDPLLHGMGEVLDRALTPTNSDAANKAGKQVIEHILDMAAAQLVKEQETT